MSKKAIEPCETCGGSGRQDVRVGDDLKTIPCHCKDEPVEPSEYVTPFERTLMAKIDELIDAERVHKATITRQAAELKRLNELFSRWQYMIDPGTDPGGCANCFHAEWKHSQAATIKHQAAEIADLKKALEVEEC